MPVVAAVLAVAAAAVSADAGVPGFCATAADCSFAGDCTAGKCVCDAWAGSDMKKMVGVI